MRHKTATWKSSDIKVIKVSSKGKVVAVNLGICSITCKIGAEKKNVNVVVLPQKVTKLSILSKTKTAYS